MADPVAYGSLPFQEQITFFLQKDDKATAAWTDIWQDEHDHEFVVAGAMKADLLSDLRGAVDKAIEEGQTLEGFRKDFDVIVDRHGWDYNGGRGWRTRVIYETNLRTSYQAGRYAQLTDPDALSAMPYWEYVHSDLVKEPREEHLAWNGLVLRADDPWWDTHFPPNGWGCQCSVRPRSERDLQRAGKSGPDSAPPTTMREVTVGSRGPTPRTMMVPDGIDPGWAYTPGQSAVARAAEQLAEKLSQWPSEIGAEAYSALATQPVVDALARDFSMWVDEIVERGQSRREWKVIGAMSPVDQAFLAERGRASATAEIAVLDKIIIGGKQRRHERAGDALTIEEWKNLPSALQRDDVLVLFSTDHENLLYVVPSATDDRTSRIAVQPQFIVGRPGMQKGINALLSAAKVSVDTLRGQIKGKKYVVVRGDL